MPPVNRPESGCRLRHVAFLALIGFFASGAVWPPTSVHAAEDGPAAAAAESDAPARDESADAEPAEEPQRELFRGKVVLAQAALKRRGIKVAEEMKNQAVLETPTGELIPIAADWRGRAFYQDERLRDRDVELVGYRREGLPYLQVLIVYMQDEKAGRREMDYWCEICAIPMYEIKECECCQGPIELRLRPAKLPDFLTAPPTAGDPGR